ncbi:MAG TPA: ABC transporter permease subunit [Streptosporangiaceae bacterium]
MTVLTLPAQPHQGTMPRQVPWRRMAWVTWRQHRATLISVPAVLGAISVFLLIAGLKIHHDYATLTACHPASSNTCGTLNTNFNRVDWTIGNTVSILLHLVPALIGAFAGAPVLARELETGTFRYAWTQGFGRERWAIAKLTLLAIAVTAVAAAFSLVFTWFFQPFLPQEDQSVYTNTVFDLRVVSFAGWTLAAFAIGVFFGMLLRRIVPAMAATLGVYLGLALAAWGVRAHYPLAVVTSNPSIGGIGPFSVNDPLVVSTWYTGPGGKPASQSVVSQISSILHNGQNPRASLTQIIAQHDLTQWTRYIPVSRFWPMQLFEGGWLLVLAVLVMAATVWLVRHRAA